LISKKTLGQFAALLVVSGAASAALPPVVDGSGRVIASPAQQASASSMLGMYNRLEQLQREVQQMRGQIEEQNYLIETLKKRQRDLYLDIDGRIAQLESGNSSASIKASLGSLAQAANSGISAQSSPSAPSQTKVSGGQDKVAYDEAFSSLKSGDYQQSIADFSQFVTTFPTSVYIPNALYWLGEASYVSRNFKRALDEFTKVVSQYPAHSKAKDAMLKIGFIQYENKQWQQARETLEKVIASYPDTTVSSLAQKRLERMRQEKH
jgi:tol-pal system protein YbgF